MPSAICTNCKFFIISCIIFHFFAYLLLTRQKKYDKIKKLSSLNDAYCGF